MNIYILTLNNTVDIERCKCYIPFLSKERRERINNSNNPKNIITSIHTGLLTNRIISKETGLSVKNIAFKYGEHGKPSLEVPGFNNDNYHFSVSHSNNCIAFVSNTAPIGIDIEQLAPARMKVAKRFFCEAEYEYLTSLDPCHSSVEFTTIWTKKEAYFKMTGDGLTKKIDSVNVLNFSDNIMFYSKNHSDYIVSVCSSNLNSPINVIDLTEEDLTQDIYECSP